MHVEILTGVFSLIASLVGTFGGARGSISNVAEFNL